MPSPNTPPRKSNLRNIQTARPIDTAPAQADRRRRLPLLIGIASGVLLLATTVVIGVLVLTIGGNPDQPPFPSTVELVVDHSEPPSTTPVVDNTEKVSLPKLREPLSGEKIYKRLLKSTVFILRKDDSLISVGSGSLVHGPRKLVLTNFHVVGDKGSVLVFFPAYRNGSVITDPSHYLDNGKSIACMGHVLHGSREKDLAIVELDRIPEEVLPLPLSTRPAEVGSKLYSVGASGIELKDFTGTLWRLSTGEVRARSNRVAKFPDQIIDAMLLESQKPINSGDSGGPSVNEYGALVGVVSMSDPRRDAVKWDIDLTEVRTYLTAFAERDGSTWDGPTSDTIPLNEDLDLIAKIASELDSTDPNTRLSAARHCVELGFEARPLIHLLFKHVEDDDERIGTTIAIAIDNTGQPRKADLALYESALRTGGKNARRVVMKVFAKDRDLHLATDLLAVIAAELDNNDSSSSRIHALTILANHRSVSKNVAFEQVLRSSGDSNKHIAEAAQQLLKCWVPLTVSDIPTLTRSLNSEAWFTRNFAVEQLSPLASDASRAREWFEPLLEDTDTHVAYSAALALSRWGSEVKVCLPKLLKLAETNDTEHATVAMNAVAKVGTTPEVLPLFSARAASSTTPLAIRVVAAERVLDAVRDQDNDLVVSSVTPLLVFPNPTVRVAALKKLADIGKPARSSIKSIIGCLDDESPTVKAAALYAVAALSPADDIPIAKISGLVSHNESTEVTTAAVRALGSQGALGVIELGKALDGRVDRATATEIVRTLGDLGNDSLPAVQSILAALDRPGHPLKELRSEKLQPVEEGKNWIPDPASDSLMRIGGDELIAQLGPLTEWEYTFAQGRKIKRAKKAANLQIQFWAVGVMAGVNPDSLSPQVRDATGLRLALLARNDPVDLVKQIARPGAIKFENAAKSGSRDTSPKPKSADNAKNSGGMTILLECADNRPVVLAKDSQTLDFYRKAVRDSNQRAIDTMRTAGQITILKESVDVSVQETSPLATYILIESGNLKGKRFVVEPYVIRVEK